MRLAILLFLLSGHLLSTTAHAELPASAELEQFIEQLNQQYAFERDALNTLFKQVNLQPAILEAMERPAEAKPWDQYRAIFMTEQRIQDGAQFWQQNAAVLSTVQQQYGVPPEVVVAIIGVETRYGASPGKYRVIDALSTLGFAYPKRSKFFLAELKQFLVLCREQNLDPLVPIGSYAGAFGLGQFMPSSYRNYARDLDGDGLSDLWNNVGDAAASIAHYFVANGWQSGSPIAFPLANASEQWRNRVSKGSKPDTQLSQLRRQGLDIDEALADSTSVKLMQFPADPESEIWLGLHNFYVITRYNHSPLYAMAVTQLSQAIKSRFNANLATAANPSSPVTR